MDWSNEPYVRMYIRETDDDLALSWEALALWRAMLCRFDRSGVLTTKRGARGLAAIVRIPADTVLRVLPELLADGRVQEIRPMPTVTKRDESSGTDTVTKRDDVTKRDGEEDSTIGFIARNFLPAQEARKSDKLRQKEVRLRRRSDGLSVTKRDGDERIPDGTVTRGHTASLSALLCSADPLITLVPSVTFCDGDERNPDGELRYEPSEAGPGRFYEYRGTTYVREVRRLSDGSHEEVVE